LEVLAINPPGRGARLREAPIEDMGGMVEGAISALAPFLDLPFLLFGHSVGALVAFEAARALEAQGLRPLHVLLSGYADPVLAKRHPSLSKASNEELITSIAGLGLLPPDVIGADGLLELLLPPLRADFGLAERHEVADGARITAPLTVLGGNEDPIVEATGLRAWRVRAEGAFEVRLFNGGHFFTETARDELLAAVAGIAALELARLPPSIMLGPQEDYPLDACLHDHFRRQANATPDALALHGATRQLTFGGLDQESDLLARQLLSLGCGVDRMVAILMETSADFVAAYLAILKAGGAYLPIPPVTPDRAIGEILESVRPIAVVASPAQARRLAGRWPAERCVILGEGWVADLKSRPLPALESMAETPGPDSLAYCVMTSGTTGKPKGIGCPHKGAVNSYWWRFAHLPYGESEREACNIFFVWEVLRPLLMGRPAYIIPDDVIFDPRRLIDFLEAHAITRVLFTPSLFEQVLNVGGAAIARRLPALRMVILNGEVVSAALAERARAVLPGIELINDYSISECHDVATSRIGEGPPAPGSRSLPAGKVMANVRVYILGDNLAPVPWGVPGEVYVAGAALARGYFDLPEMTAERFLPDPFQGGQERMFRTGDAGRALPDGQLEIQGRSHFMIKLRGYSVVPSAVEAAIAAFPAIGAVIAVPIDDPATGQAASLAAYIVGRERSLTGEDLTALRAHLKDRLPAYAIPADLIELPELPIQASTGKVDRKKLPPPSPQPGRERRAGVPPLRAGVERDMSALWSKVLGRPTIAPSDSFFDLGGHSLLAIKLALSAENRFGVALNVVDVFNYPTLGAFSEYIARKLGERRVPEPKSLSKARPRHSCAGPADIAVIGMACRFPGCDCPEQLWDKLMGGVECIRKFSDEELRARGVPERLISNPAYMRAGAILEDVALFDPAFFGLSEREAILMDPQHRLFLECCWEALERAGYAPSGHDVLTGIYAGCYLPTYLVHHLGAARHLDAGDPASFLLTEIGNDKDYLASRAAYVLGLEGPAISVQTSCSTGLIAIAEAAEALRCGRCDMALAGASSITFPQGGYLYAEGFIGARDGHCRTFDHGASGTILGDGVGVVVLRRLEDALTAGDTVLAVIKGYATNNDGAARAGFSAPSVRGQAQVISAAFNMAEADASSISYVEAHGTATLIGDPIEVRALTQAFRQHTAAKGFCVIGSAKANLGHSNIAAGVAGFMKTVLMLRHRQIPPLINFTRPNPELKLEETPFRIETVASAWEALGSEPRRAGVSSFGIGGTNAHMILEEAPDTAAAPSEPACVEILPVSAKTASALCAVTRRLAGDLGANPAPPVSEAAAALQLGRAAFPWRRAEIATSREEAVARLSSQRDVERCAQISGGIALVFPGQGAKLTGLDPDLMTRCPAFARVFAKCRELFLERAVDIDDLFDEAEAARLMAKAPGLQAALFATEYALGQTLMAFGLRPTALAGHSLGQIVAATIAGVMPLEQAVSLVAVRAEAMEEAAPGAMLSVSAGGPELDGLMGSYPGVVIAASNSPRDIVVSGPEQDIAKLEQAAAKAGLACRRLAVSRAFHSPLMKDTALRVADAAASMRFDPPNIPVACNITGGWLDAHSAKNAGEYWSRHILAPVAFAANAMALSALRPSLVVEAGPGRSLTRLISECVRAAKEARPIMLSAMRHPSERGASDWEALCRCLARLWESGFDVDWRAFREGRSRRRATLSTYPFERRRCWPANDAALSQEAVPHIETKLPPQERFYVPSFRQVSAPSTSRGRAPICWLLLRDGGGSRGALADVLERELRAYGDDVEGLDRAGRAQLASVLERLGGREKAARVLSLWSLQEGGRRQRAQEQTAEALELAKTLASRRNASPLFVFAVFERAFTSPGPSADPDAAGAVGPLLVLGQEHPAISVRFIDVDLTRAPGIVPLARQIASECAVAQPRREATVMLRAGRFVERFDPLSLGDAEREAGRRRLAEGPHIVTGGLGRIGLALARHLTEIGAAVVLTSRRPAIEPVSAAQGLIEVRRLNLASRQETESLLLDVARRYGRLGGIFHAAGLARLAGLCDISPDLLSAELEPKVSGTINLEKAIRQIRGDLHIEPSFVMTFSSLASVLGGLGMAAYASANRIMDALAAATSAPGRTPWISVRWDDWDFDYGEQQVGAYAQTRARFSISPEEALGAIEAILGEETLRDVLVSATPLQPRLDRWVNGREPFAVQPPEKPNGAGDPDARRGSSPAEDRVRAAYAKVLGAEKACLDDNFFDLGGDSLLATQIVLELGRYPGGTAGLRVTDVFDHPTIRGLAAKLAPSSHTKPQPALETDNTQGDAL
jgi:amino acid adenylation domain-containing protein